MNLDSLKVGLWIVVTDRKQEPTDGYQDTSPFMMMKAPDNFEPTGQPMKIVAISLPFIAIRPAIQPEQLAAVDISRYVIRKADKKYVKVFIDQYKASKLTTQQKGMP